MPQGYGSLSLAICLALMPGNLLNHPLAAEKIQLPDKPPSADRVPVRHLERSSDGWSVAATVNFRIHYYAKSAELAEQAARAAEQARTDVQRKWFGAAVAWDAPCQLYLYANREDYSRYTGIPAHVPGRSTINCDGSRVILRRIDLAGDNPTMLTAVLPHEVAHTVLAGQFGVHQVPRWVDEGMAVLSEPRRQIDRLLRELPRHRQESGLYSVRQLVQLQDYPERRYVGVFYVQSVSLVEFLVGARDPRTFVRFVRDGLQGGYETALEKHYGWDFAELERRWRRHAFEEPAVAVGAGG